MIFRKSTYLALSWRWGVIPAIFWVVTQRVVVIANRRFRTTYGPHLQGPLNVGKKLPLLVT